MNSQQARELERERIKGLIGKRSERCVLYSEPSHYEIVCLDCFIEADIVISKSFVKRRCPALHFEEATHCRRCGEKLSQKALKATR